MPGTVRVDQSCACTVGLTAACALSCWSDAPYNAVARCEYTILRSSPLSLDTARNANVALFGPLEPYGGMDAVRKHHQT